MTPSLRPRTLRVLGLFALPTLAAACELPFSSGGERDELEEARARWERAGIQTYDLRVRVSCFCPSELVRGAVIRVQNGQPVSYHFIDTGEPAPAELFQDKDTVEELFARAEHVLEEADEFRIRYDDTLGYPELMDVDYMTNAIDDEMTYSAEVFTDLD